MEDYLKAALEIVKAQASVRTMTDEEITSMLKNVAAGIQAVADAETLPAEAAAPVMVLTEAVGDRSSSESSAKTAGSTGSESMRAMA